MTEAPIPPAVLKSNKSGSPISNLDMPLPRRSAGGESFLSEQAGGVKLGKLGNDENFSPKKLTNAFFLLRIFSNRIFFFNKTNCPLSSSKIINNYI